MTSPRVLGVVIANGLASESRVYANLLAARGGDYRPLTLFHVSGDGSDPKVAEGAEQFASISNSPVERIDCGWRRGDGQPRSLMAKVQDARALGGALPAALKAARSFRPNLVYSSQQRWDCSVATLLAAANRVPQVIHLHYTIGPYLGRLPLARLRSARGVVCVSEYIASLARRYGILPERTCVVPNTVLIPTPEPAETRSAVRQELGLEQDACVLSFVARLAEGKGHADTLDALSRVIGEHPKLRLLVVGDGPSFASLVERARALGIERQVRFLGFRSDVHRLNAASDIFVHPSLDEPFGLSILEAGAVGLPTIAYRDGGPTEIIVDGETGVLVPPRDVDGLARAILDLSADEALRIRLGKAAALRAARHFAPERHAAAFAAFLRRCSSA